jgi:hypothetical protein
MKFFTRGWVRGDVAGEAADAVPRAYLEHLHRIGLPPAVRDLADLNPHDAHVLDVANDPAAAALRLRLRCGDLQRGYVDAVLEFAGATIEPADLAALDRARRPAEYEVLGDEVDAAGAGAFEYRLLLDPAGEAAVRFTDVTVVCTPVADRWAVT